MIRFSLSSKILVSAYDFFTKVSTFKVFNDDTYQTFHFNYAIPAFPLFGFSAFDKSRRML